MMILFLALIFGIVVAGLLVFSILRNRKIVNILELIILAEAIAYIVVFIIVIIETMAA